MKQTALDISNKVYYNQYLAGIFQGYCRKPARMQIHRTLKGFDQGRDVTLVFSWSSPKKVQGKYLVGFLGSESNQVMVVFDESAVFHRDIALRHRLRPRGGGWLEITFPRKRIRLSGRSQAYGRDPDRDLTRRLLAIAFPGFSCTCEE